MLWHPKAGEEARHRHLTPALVLAVIALLVALAGSASAVATRFHYLNKHLGSGAVDSRVVRDHAIAATDFSKAAVASLRRAGSFGAMTVVTRTIEVAPPFGLARVEVACPDGFVSLSGGVRYPGPPGAILDSHPSDGFTGAEGHTGWSSWVFNATADKTVTVELRVICAPSSAVPPA